MKLESSLIKCPNCGSSEVRKGQGPDYQCVYCSASFRVFVNFEGVGPASGIDDIWRCHQCGLKNSVDSVHCGGCGTDLVEKCPSCSEVKRNILLYCPRCGINVDDKIKELYRSILQKVAGLEILLKGTDLNEGFPFGSRELGVLYHVDKRFAAYPAYSNIVFRWEQISRCSSAFSGILEIRGSLEQHCYSNRKKPPEPDSLGNPFSIVGCTGCGGTILGLIILLVAEFISSFTTGWGWFLLGPILVFMFIMCVLSSKENKRLNDVKKGAEGIEERIVKAELNYSAELEKLKRIPIPPDVLQKMREMS